MRSRTLALTAALALGSLALLAHPRVACAQEEAPPPEDKDADWQESFQRGLDLLRDRKVDKSIEAFEACRKLVPNKEEMILDYNVACAHAQKKDAAKACVFLKKAFDGGFLDLAHVARDTDLDPIREDGAFKKLIATTRAKVLEARANARRIVPEAAASSGKRPLLVYVAKSGDSAEDVAKKLSPVAESVGCVALVVTGSTEAHAWDSTAETCIVVDVEEELADEALAIDPERVVVAGEGDGARHALQVGLAHGWKRIVAAAGNRVSLEAPGAADAKDARVYLVAPALAEYAQVEAVGVRNAVLEAGGHVVVERPGGLQVLARDFAATLERAVRWTLGEKVKLAGTDAPRKL